MGVVVVFIFIFVVLFIFGVVNGLCFIGGRYGILGLKEIVNVLKYYIVFKIKWILKFLLENIVN